jgi:hypothetical protein
MEGKENEVKKDEWNEWEKKIKRQRMEETKMEASEQPHSNAVLSNTHMFLVLHMKFMWTSEMSIENLITKFDSSHL